MNESERSREAVRDVVASLVEARKSKQLAQWEVAERMFTSPPTISNFEAGKTSPRLATLIEYAIAVGARLEVAIGGENNDVEP